MKISILATMWKYLFICMLAEYAFCEDLSSRPTDSTIKKEENAFDVIMKKNSESASSLGRSVDKEKVELVQGDMAVTKDEESLLKLGRTTAQDNIVLIWPRKLWQGRVVPYVIRDFAPYSAGYKAILGAFRYIEKISCIRYRPKRSTDKAWIRVYNGKRGCWANIGRSIAFGKTKVSVGCSTSRVLVVHELLHALGFFHEQSRRDRDNYVKLLTWNIQPQNRYNFKKAKKHEMDTFGLPYDYKSIMHYSRTTWTKDGRNTMEAKNDPNLELGGEDLSSIDIQRINALYHCHEKAGVIWTEWSDWSLCIKNWRGCYRSKHRICLSENLAHCPEADVYGVHSIPQKCASAAYCDLEPIDGFWAQWSSWSRCTKSCDRGTKVRYRKCNSPAPSNGGRNCKGRQSDTEKCMLKRCRPNGLDATFEDGLGMWKNVQGSKDPLEWQRGRGQMNRNSGPTGDHTTGSGWYLYVSSINNHKKRATIESAQLYGKKCISFAYQLNGKNMGKLDIFAKRSDGVWILFSPKKKPIGHQGKGWKHVELTVNHPSYKFYFEATIGIGPYSDIAIDDIFIDDGGCGETKKTESSTPGKTPLKPISQGCKNKDKRCVGWANTGECHFNPKYMLASCCLACRGMSDCNKKEYSSECKNWAQKGECQKNSRWMWKNCCKSCKEMGDCNKKEYSSKCKDWAQKGECQKNSGWMWKNCCKSCKE